MNRRAGGSGVIVVIALGAMAGIGAAAYWMLNRSAESDAAERAGKPVGKSAPADDAKSIAARAEPEISVATMQRYLPDDIYAMAIVRHRAIYASDTAVALEKQAPYLRKFLPLRELAGSEYYIGPDDIVASVTGMNLGESDTNLVLLRKKPSPVELLSRFWPDEYRKFRVGKFAVYETQSLYVLRDPMGLSDGKPVFDGSGHAFCIVKPNLLLVGQAKRLKEVLTRGRPAKFSPALLSGLSSLDRSHPVSLVVALKELRGKKGKLQSIPYFVVVSNKCDVLTGWVVLDKEITIQANASCIDEKGAQEIKGLADAGLVLLKSAKDVPSSAVALLRAMRISVDGARINASLQIELSQLASIVNRAQQDFEEPRGYSRALRDLASVDPLTVGNALRRLGEIGPEAKAAVPKIVELLKHKDAKVRSQAANALGSIGMDAHSALPALVASVHDDEVEVRMAVAWSLGRIGAVHKNVVPTLIELLADKKSNVRKAAADGLFALGPDASAAVAALVNALKDANNEVATAAARAMGSIGPSAAQAVEPLVNVALHGKGRYLPKAAGKALARIGAPALRPLIAALEHDDAGVRLQAVNTLQEFATQGADAVSALAGRLEDTDAHVRRAAGIALASIGPAAKTALRQLIAAVKDENYGAVSAIGAIGPAAVDAVPALVQLLSRQRRTSSEAGWIINALGAIGPAAREAIPALRGLASSERHAVGVARARWKIEGDSRTTAETLANLAKQAQLQYRDAVKALAEMGPAASGAVPVLVELLKSEKWSRDRKDLLIALVAIGPAAEAAVPVLIELVRTRTRRFDDIAAKAAQALEAIGPAAQDAIPALIRAVDRYNYKLQPAAALALSNMGPPAKRGIPVLEEQLDSEHRRLHAAYGLWKLDGRIDCPLRIATLTIKHARRFDEEHLLAIKLLEELGERAKPALPALKRMLHHEEANVRRAAAKALARIGRS